MQMINILLVGAGLSLSSGLFAARQVFLNGVDISSAINQELEGAVVRIDERGNIFLSAPQYQVHEEETFVPLARQKAVHAATPEVSSKVGVSNKEGSGAIDGTSAQLVPQEQPPNEEQPQK